MSKQCHEELDELALIACQHYNLKNDSNWFFSFRVGQHGVLSRMQGLERHSWLLHQWTYPPQGIMEQEHNLTVMLLCMDSALECFVFMINALGQAVDQAAFRSVATDKSLRGISPADILGAGRGGSRPGYQKYFPSMTTLWEAKRDVIRLIVDNHDVSKHRQQAFSGGQFRTDPPVGFFEGLGIQPGSPQAMGIGPMQTVSLSKSPKLPIDEIASARDEWTTLEYLEGELKSLIRESFCAALRDARTTIVLPDPTLHP